MSEFDRLSLEGRLILTAWATGILTAIRANDAELSDLETSAHHALSAAIPLRSGKLA